MEHNGPMFAPAYKPLPESAIFEYDGQPMKLSLEAEEIAGFYARLLDHAETSNATFNANFFEDFRRNMNENERKVITELTKCNFKHMHAFFKDQSQKNRNRTTEEKLALKKENEALLAQYGYAIVDKQREKIEKFKIEPPGLFRGRGERSNIGKLKRRIMPEDVIINCSNDSKVPEPPAGHAWKEVRNNNTVSWLASWTDEVQKKVKYIKLDRSSQHMINKDRKKFETASQLLLKIDGIRKAYEEDLTSEYMQVRQRAVALYLIDKLALSAG